MKKSHIAYTRRQFLARATATGVGLMALPLVGCQTGLPERQRLAPIPDADGILDLPPGFSYSILTRTGDAMDDGLLVPGAPDGTGAFAAKSGRVVLVRNHELHSGHAEISALAGGGTLGAEALYDAGQGSTPGHGGTTTLVYDLKSNRVESQHLSLAGTYRNCAGGVTPWGSWISCEESVDLRGEWRERNHGYCFEVPAHQRGIAPPRPLKEMGRFNHEAIAVDPSTGIVYLTEDRRDGLFYRFVPEQPGRLAAGGRLQALRIPDGRTDTRNWAPTPELALGEKVTVEWVDLEEADAPQDDLRERGFQAKGAARFARGEGIWYTPEGMYFTCTAGGSNKRGQVFRYRLTSSELELFVEPNDTDVLESPDNLTVAPWGEVFVCEDSPGSDRMVRLDAATGSVSTFAKNALNDSELTGPAFSPDGTVLFVHIQTPGMLLAIRGPW